MRITLLFATVAVFCLAALMTSLQAQADKAEGDAIAGDFKLIQGKWELFHGNEGKGPPTVRTVKEVNGNRETLRRYIIATDKMFHEHSMEFTLSTSGNVRVFTFYPVGGNPKEGQSYVYKVDAENFYDIPGLLHGDDYRNYQETPTIWHWKRVKEEKRDGDVAKDRTTAESKSTK